MPTAIQHIIDKTIEYLAIPSVVGHEQSFKCALNKEFEDLGLQTYMHDGLLEIHGSKPQSAILSAHIDRHGLISLGNGEYVYAAQYMKKIKYGEDNKNSKKELENIAARFTGEKVFAYDPQSYIKIAEGIITTCDICFQNGEAAFYIDGMGDIPQNTPVAYARKAQIDHTYLKGQIDNTLCIAMIYALFEAGFQGTALLTIEEEIGKSWIHISRWLDNNHIDSQDLLIVDTSPFADADPVKEGRIIFRNRDMSAPFNIDMTQRLIERCQSMNIPLQIKDLYLQSMGRKIEQLGSTELGRLIQNHDNRWSGATIQIPTLMYHTSYETTSVKAIENYYNFLKDIVVENPLPLTYKIK